MNWRRFAYALVLAAFLTSILWGSRWLVGSEVFEYILLLVLTVSNCSAAYTVAGTRFPNKPDRETLAVPGFVVVDDVVVDANRNAPCRIELVADGKFICRTHSLAVAELREEGTTKVPTKCQIGRLYAASAKIVEGLRAEQHDRLSGADAGRTPRD